MNKEKMASSTTNITKQNNSGSKIEVEEEMKDKEKPLEQQCYYHGVLPAAETDRLLTEDGEFLVRREGEKQKQVTLISVLCRKTTLNIEPKASDGVYIVENKQFSTIPELMFHHYFNKVPISTESGALLLRPKKAAHWFLNNDQVTCTKKIGSGQFGEVHIGTLDANGFKKEVAIKLCLSVDAEEKGKFVDEATMMLKYDHSNIVKVIGVAATREPIMLILEYVAGGSLDKYLQFHTGQISQKLMMKWCVLGARGMHYLERQGCIHRDLAARNCLVTARKQLKIADFGLSRVGNQYCVQSKNIPIPIRWTALEVFRSSMYSHKTDVWSFGILMWEIYSEGDTPYSDIEENRKVIAFVRDGNRMKAPRLMSHEINYVMQSCWITDPQARPKFGEVRYGLETAYDKFCSVNERSASTAHKSEKGQSHGVNSTKKPRSRKQTTSSTISQ